MAQQLQIFVDLRPNAFQWHFKPVLGRRTRTRTMRRGIQAHGGFSVSRESISNTDIRISFKQGGSGMPSSSVAAPGYSSLPRRSKRPETSIQAGDGFVQIEEWVYRKVKDPMVEIDPVTVEETIKAEEEIAREEQEAREKRVTEQDECEPSESSEDTIATLAPPTSLRPQSELSRAGLSTKAAGAALILTAVCLAYLGFRSKSALSKPKQNSEPFLTLPGPAGIGGKRDAGTSRVIIHHSPSKRTRSPPQDLREQFRCSSDGDSSDKAVALRASVVLSSSQSQTAGISRPALPSHGEKTAFPSSSSVLTPHESIKEEEENAANYEELSFPTFSSDSDIPLAKPLEEILALNGVGHDSNPAEAKLFEEVVAVNDVGHDNEAESEIEAKPFEEVVAVNGVGHYSNPAEVAEPESEAKPFEEVVAVNGAGHNSTPTLVTETETDAVEFQNALIFDKPQAAEGLWPEEDIQPAVTSAPEYPGDLAEVSGRELPSVDFQNAVLPATPLETSPELKPIIPIGTSSPELLEDLVVSSLDADFPPEPVKEDGPVKEILTGAAASTSDAQAEEEKRKSYAQAIEAVVPAIAVGAGALSTLSGVNSGLEMVGLVATASFLVRELVMASSRQRLFGDFSKVKDHKSFLEFLQRRDIIKKLPQE